MLEESFYQKTAHLRNKESSPIKSAYRCCSFAFTFNCKIRVKCNYITNLTFCNELKKNKEKVS